MGTKKKIKEYFKDAKLEVLNKNSKEYIGVYGAFPNEHYYGAVSLNYIHKYVLKEKVTKRFVARKIAELMDDKYLLPIPCNFADDIVFCNYEWSIGKPFVKFSWNSETKTINIGFYMRMENSKFRQYKKEFESYL